jgi:kynurenine formamidase
MVANTGTYVDSPFHRYADGPDLAHLPLESLADLPGLVVRAAGRPARGIDVAALAGLVVRGKAVLLHTGWDVHWRTDRYFEGHPFLTAAGAAWLADHGAALVGIDSLNIDDTADPRRSAHSTLLRRDIPVVEHLCGLDRLPDAGFRFFAVPVKVRLRDVPGPRLRRGLSSLRPGRRAPRPSCGRRSSPGGWRRRAG